MTDENSSISRRSMLAATGTLGITSLSGCLDPTSDSWILSENSGVRPDPTASLSDVQVKEAPTSRSNPYFIALSNDIVEGEDISVFNGQQVRMEVQDDVNDEYLSPCIYTVNSNPEYTSEDEKTVWMSEAGMERLGVVDGTLLTLRPYSASARFETRDAGQENNELIEQYIDNSDENILFMAPHGGEMYSKTELQAIRGSSVQNYSSWALMGYGQSEDQAMTKWYNPPELYSPNSFLGLLELEYPFRYAVSFSGINKSDDSSTEKVVIGGLAEDGIKEAIQDRLEYAFTPESERQSSEDSTETESTEIETNPTIEITIAYEGDVSGSEPNHIANDLSGENSNGIMIQQTKSVRDDHWKKVADAVIEGIETYRDEN